MIGYFFFFQAEDGIRDPLVTGVQTCALPILHETAGDVTVVVFDKNDAVPEASFATEFVDLLDERLAGFIARMGFARENKLHRPRRVVEQSMQPFLVVK